MWERKSFSEALLLNNFLDLPPSNVESLLEGHSITTNKFPFCTICYDIFFSLTSIYNQGEMNDYFGVGHSSLLQEIDAKTFRQKCFVPRIRRGLRFPTQTKVLRE